MKESYLEDLIKDTLLEEAQRIDVPPSDTVWAKIDAARKKKKLFHSLLHKNGAFRFQLAAASLIIFILGTLLYFTHPSAVNARSNRILKTVVDLFRSPAPADIIITMDNTSTPPPDAPPPPPDWPLATGEKVVAPEQARAEASFSFKEPSYLTRGLKLDIITLMDKNMVNQYYRSDKNRLIISQRHMPGDFASSHMFSNVRAKKVNINGVEGTLVSQRNPYSGKDELTIIWFADSISFRVETDLNERETLKIVRSLK
jgi:hypothetical protein